MPPTTRAATGITASSVTIARGIDTLFMPVSFAAAQGKGILITGENGVGKSSLLRGIAGLLPLASGTVHMPDWPITYVGHVSPIKDQQTVRDFLQFWQILDTVPEGFLPSTKKRGHALSAGQRRRLGLSLLWQKKGVWQQKGQGLWLLDEPTTSLDAQATDILLQHCTQFLAQGGIIIAATHDTTVWPETWQQYGLERSTQQDAVSLEAW